MQNTLTMLTHITQNYDDQAQALGSLKASQQSIEERISNLEKRPVGRSVPASTADTAQEGSKRPAIILGGWHPDQLTGDTLKAAKAPTGSAAQPQENVCTGGPQRLCHTADHTQAS